MTAAVSTIDIDRPPDEMFAYVTDPTRFAEWQHDVVGVRLESGGPVGLGTRFTTTRRIGGVERTMTQEVTEDSRPGRWAVHGVDGPIRPSVTVTVEPLDEGARSRVTFALDFAGHGVGVPLVPMVRRLAAKGAPASYRHLKERLETGVS
ncbi:SRPBCC family protein [Micromonospora sp. U56]|uniref:SRPBCC family protein n=1 Tax=Micromonospora sp. U56 TaxID=2824900 RepID=UPI001B365C21|nr:SRPBCC family protein [Micromonospora sp. U56]MBQ0892325.1 SRPBCC family protein [Micromonospora sp. U56]